MFATSVVCSIAATCSLQVGLLIIKTKFNARLDCFVVSAMTTFHFSLTINPFHAQTHANSVINNEQ